MHREHHTVIMALKPSPSIHRIHGYLTVGGKPTSQVGFHGFASTQAPSTSSTRKALEDKGLIAAGGISGGTPTAVVATTDGLTTGIIPDSAESVSVTSSASTKIVTLPTPTPGRTLRVIVGANGCKLKSTAPATIAINGGTGSAVVSAISANVVLFLTCVDATHWTGYQTSSVGAVTAIAVAA